MMAMGQPEHGGGLNAAAERHGIPRGHWLDLSTGINPRGWPVPDIPSEVFARLPEVDDQLEMAAADYYGCDQLLPLAGSQQGIQLLPRLRQALCGSGRVGVLTPGYAEHRHHWQLHGHDVKGLSALQIESRLPQLEVLVLINPCNPSGCSFTPEQLERWRAQLAARGGWLVVDEAFIDATPELSLLGPELPRGLIILRSLGKFFGLAGLRVGFLFAESTIRHALAPLIGPWALAHPSRWLATKALQDQEWQRFARVNLRLQQQRLVDLLARFFVEPVSSTSLFAWIPTERAESIQQRLAMRAVLVRCFNDPPGLRFGLPGSEAQWRQLEHALQEIKQ
ncbi:threonine-phosphate decarboxylase CobD [Marinobacterium sp. D7]|uniref:threonine-phosphate decarboxylase CobD n=1 Tax=Marinobacterium ramblicola TaxID=2849041 RepID=UPI001C2D66A2|nr:threonine-phosphate decarboxylase CobD [Marinobacterium ramblicola]MBV1788462.1 threonine-phosphate decarboxylase CobD [Marinobacterium ramblicola]